MKQKNDGEKPHYLRLALAGVGILLLLALNYLYFREKTSSNSELITRYTRKADPMEKYRNPAVAGLFYAAAPQTLDREVSGYLQAAGGAYEKMPKMLIVPHAGYQYSAPAAARAYRPLAALAGRIKTVILLGPSHRVPVDGLALSSADWFVTPLGKVPVDREMTAGLAARKGFRINDAAHRDEHSLEVQLPFLQKVLTDFEIVPIVYGAMNPQETAEALLPYLQRDDTLLVVSADLSHYYTYEEAQAADRETAAKIKEVSPEIGYHQSCGAGGINSALILAQMMRLRPEILSLINSGDTAGSRERVVGYGAWVFAGTGGLERETAALADYAAVYKRTCCGLPAPRWKKRCCTAGFSSLPATIIRIRCLTKGHRSLLWKKTVSCGGASVRCCRAGRRLWTLPKMLTTRPCMTAALRRLRPANWGRSALPFRF